MPLIKGIHGPRLIEQGVYVGSIVRIPTIEDHFAGGMQLVHAAPSGKLWVCCVLGLEPKGIPGLSERVQVFDAIGDIFHGMSLERER